MIFEEYGVEFLLDGTHCVSMVTNKKGVQTCTKLPRRKRGDGPQPYVSDSDLHKPNLGVRQLNPRLLQTYCHYHAQVYMAIWLYLRSGAVIQQQYKVSQYPGLSIFTTSSLRYHCYIMTHIKHGA